ncbi:type II secretion system protein GspL [Reinekea marina]|uniref:Type II secretion system protein L n=1 Tax=Reinekea marina TaxID=1310421 RepID=A0ABV7WP36_9GAMM|nr:type II secretion system protein GspL [Reinekea marina]MDN3649500.1 type II secretion system protein GspL [Reinekea marina]
MSIQLSLYWQDAQNISWYWAEENSQFNGTLEELEDQVQQRNLAQVVTRLFLPAGWFTTFPVQLPKGAKRVSSQMLSFAAEEFIAQNIEDVHLVMLGKPQQGEASVCATAKEPFLQVISTLKTRNMNVFEAYDAGQFLLPHQSTHDVDIHVNNEQVSIRSGLNFSQAHYRGFPQWFEHWLSQNGFEENLSIMVYSAQTDGAARNLVTSLETNGHKVEWVIQEDSSIAQWAETASSSKSVHNLLTANLRPGTSNKHARFWVPTSIAAVFSLVVWSAYTGISTMRLQEQADQTWQASEAVFKQVFGDQKRIQRPLMVREMRNKAASIGSSDSKQPNANALTVLNDLRSANATLQLEDLRYNQDRNETTFTLVSDAQSDAFNHFEALKTELSRKGYSVEYSASQDRDAVRAKFKSVLGG